MSITNWRSNRRVGAHGHRPRRGRDALLGEARVLERLIHDVEFLILEERGVRVRQRASTAARIGARCGIRLVPWVVGREIGCVVTDEGIERLRPKELHGMLPLLGTDERRVGDDLESGRLERLVQLTQALFLAAVEKTVELVDGGGLLRDLVDIVVKGFGVEDRGGDRVILVVQRSEEVVLLQPKLPEGPGPTAVRIVHSPAVGNCGFVW